MRNLALAAAASLALLATSARADDPHVALLKNVTGTIAVHRGGASVPAVSGMTLFVADRLVSSPGASAGIVFKDGTLLTLGPATEVQVRDYVFKPKEATYAFDVFLARGSAVYSSGKIGKVAPEAVKVGTPTATVGVRGTRFIVEAE
ncbi:FecR family protein [Piscinibacter koreensis]|uniref:FecR family protein n=1 Tax=Piscinibacter koreensis TaxID=2742824 RepID=UPI001C375D5D|nr:FecR family protein [Schlegelella koreensis]